jgi:hypothetical protein
MFTHIFVHGLVQAQVCMHANSKIRYQAHACMHLLAQSCPHAYANIFVCKGMISEFVSAHMGAIMPMSVSTHSCNHAHTHMHTLRPRMCNRGTVMPTRICMHECDDAHVCITHRLDRTHTRIFEGARTHQYDHQHVYEHKNHIIPILVNRQKRYHDSTCKKT